MKFATYRFDLKRVTDGEVESLVGKVKFSGGGVYGIAYGTNELARLVPADGATFASYTERWVLVNNEGECYNVLSFTEYKDA